MANRRIRMRPVRVNVTARSASKVFVRRLKKRSKRNRMLRG